MQDHRANRPSISLMVDSFWHSTYHQTLKVERAEEEASSIESRARFGRLFVQNVFFFRGFTFFALKLGQKVARSSR